MNELMQRALAEMADDAPIARVGQDVWRRGRGRRRRRLIGTTLAVLVVMLPTGLVLRSVTLGDNTLGVEQPPTFPARIAAPPQQLSTVEEAPNPPAIVAFTADTTQRSGLTVVGLDGSHRFLPTPTDPWLLSPDGYRVAVPGGVYHMATGMREAIPGALRPLAWDRSGPRLLYMDDGDVYLYEMVSKSSRKLFARPARLGIEAAFSPDGAKLAALWDHRLHIIDVPTGAVEWSVDVADGRFAGPAAWTPDGQRIAVLQQHGEMWRLGFADRSGRLDYEQRPPRLGEAHGVVGWRGDDPLVIVDGVEPDGVALVLAPAEGPWHVLMVVEKGKLPLQVPQHLVERARFVSRS